MRHLGALVILLLLPSVVAAAQTAPADKEQATRHVTLAFAQKLVEQWTSAVRTHVAGTPDEPVKTIASWPPDYVILVVRLVAPTLDARSLLMRGLSLHTDIAIAEQDAKAPPGLGRGGAVILVDGQVTRYIGRSAHWPIARQIAAELAKPTGARPAEGPRVAAWYRATAALMQQWRDLDLLGMHLEAGQKLFVDDPVLALYQGTLRQAFSDPRLYDYLRKRGSTEGWGKPPLASRHGALSGSSPARLGPMPTAVPAAARVELGVAGRELRRAMTLDPTLHEARIRLAHVLSRMGDDRKAVEVVRPALEAPLAPFSEFYAALILGRSEEQLGHFDEAGVAYARAAARFPGAQSAEIGRSRVALAQGRAADAQKILADVVGPDSTEQPDPWLAYLTEHDPDAETLLEAWRADLK
ncbi:MAG: tetratricopeptide repeat protein [Vicinamibacteria bacterium]